MKSKSLTLNARIDRELMKVIDDVGLETRTASLTHIIKAYATNSRVEAAVAHANKKHTEKLDMILATIDSNLDKNVRRVAQIAIKHALSNNNGE